MSNKIKEKLIPIEEIELKFFRYRDKDSLPTCALSFPENQVCTFLGFKCFGTKPHCMYSMKPIYREESGFLIPLTECPLWNNTQS